MPPKPSPTLSPGPAGAPPENYTEAELNALKERVEQTKDIAKQINDAKDEIKRFFDAKLAKNLNQRGEAAASAVRSALIFPLNLLQQNYNYRIDHAFPFYWEDSGNIKGFKSEVKERVELAKSYVGEMAKDQAIDETLLAKMNSNKYSYATFADTFANAGKFAEELYKGTHEKLRTAIKWTLKNSIDTEGEKPEVYATLQQYSEKYFDLNNDSAGLMPVIWRSLGFMEPKHLEEFMMGYKDPQGNTHSGYKDHILATKGSNYLEAFLIAGNKYGVFTASNMEKFGFSGMTPEKHEEFATIWQMQNDFHQETKRLMGSTWGTKNAAGEMLTLGNIALFLGKAAAITTVAGNAIFGAVKLGAMKRWDLIIPNMLNTNTAIGLAVYGAIKAYESKRSLREFTETKAEKTAKEKEEAVNELNLRRNSSSGEKWQKFFDLGHDKDGAEAFAEFIDVILEDGKDPKVFLKPAIFAEFLRQKAAAGANPKINYQKVSDEFENQIMDAQSDEDDKELQSYGQIFRTLYLQQYSSYDEAIAAAKTQK